MLTRLRLVALCALGSTVTLASLVSAPAATAAPVRPAKAAAEAGIPASAKSRLTSEMLKAWQITRGQGVTVAVLSTAVDDVSGLSGKLITGPDYAPLAGAPATDGTVLASMIAGSGPTGSNPFGNVGRAPGARILAERIVDYGAGARGDKYTKNPTWQDNEAKAIRYAVSHHASVIVTNVSGYSDTSALDEAVAYAISKNVVVLGADMRFGSTPDQPMYPDSLPGVINFSGTALKGLPVPAKPVPSPVNDSILVTVPDNVMTATGPGSEPYTAWGNYSTIAWAAGTVALIKAVYPQISPALVARALAESASYHPAGGYNTTVGFGLINPIGALDEAGTLVKLHTTAAPGPAHLSAAAHFGGPVPAVIDAVHHAPAKLAGDAAAIVIGLALLVLALLLHARRRRRSRPAPPVVTA